MADASFTAELEGYGNLLLESFGKLLLEQCLVDLTLISNSQSIKIHKCVLIASSSYFKERLANSQENVIVFKTNFAVLMAIVEFIYFGKTAYLESDADALISAAKLFDIKGLSAIKYEGELPEFPQPIFITELSCGGDTGVPKVIPDTIEEIDFNISSDKNDSPKYYARFPIVLNEQSPLNDMNPHSLKRKRGRPRRNSNIVKLNNAIKQAIEHEAKNSMESFELLKAIQAKNKNMDEGLQMAIDSIRIPENAVNNISDPYFDNETGNKMWSELDILENLEIPEDLNSNSEKEMSSKEEFFVGMSNVNNEVPNSVPILFEYSDGSFVNISNEMCLDIAEDIECKMEEADSMDINQSDKFAGILNILDGNISDQL